ncbi:MAG: PTS sugar transporter subunit IIA [Peptostreptococcaceae bacterium]
MLKELIKVENICMDLKSNNKDDVISEMINILDYNGCIKNNKKFKKDIYKREEQSNTGIGFGVAIPHAKSKYVKECTIGVGISKEGIEYGSIDGEKVNLMFMIAIEGNEQDLHLKALAALSRKLIHEEFREKLINASSSEEIYSILSE